MTSVRGLAGRWREEASKLRERYGLEELARTCEVHATELEEALRVAEDELLEPDEAARVSGYSKRRLRELEAEGVLENHGRKGAPRYRASELPRRKREDSTFDASAAARRMLGGSRR